MDKEAGIVALSKSDKLLNFFPENMRAEWERYNFDFNDVREVRLRVNQPVRVLCDREIRLAMVYGERDMEEIFRYLCHDSVYAYEEERKQGYIMADGGHRIGITGELAALENGRFIAKYIRYINIRLAHEHKSIAEGIIDYVCEAGSGQPLNTLIVSPPGLGKTTLLRDTIRLLSNGVGDFGGCNVGVVDERGEIAGAYRGSALLDCGERTDVITGGNKRQGISILVRTFAPRVIAIDEIGGEPDAQSIFYAGVSGCGVIATAHGRSLDDVKKKRELTCLFEQNIFKRFILISAGSGTSRYASIYDERGNELCGRKLLRAYA